MKFSNFVCALAVDGVCNITTVLPPDESGISLASWQYGGWKINNCDLTQVQTLIAALDRISNGMPAVISEAGRGSLSPIFRMFFQDNSDPSSIQDIYRKIGAGGPLQRLKQDGQLGYKEPELTCSWPDDWTATWYERCLTHHAGASTEEEGGYTILCSAYWQMAYPSANVTRPPSCPTTTNNTHALPHNSYLVQTKVATVLHELWHQYTYNTTADQFRPEVYHMDECAALPQSKSRRNANNYAFFAASK